MYLWEMQLHLLHSVSQRMREIPLRTLEPLWMPRSQVRWWWIRCNLQILCVSLGYDEVTDVFPWLGARCFDISFGCLCDKPIHAISALRVFQGIEVVVQRLEEVSVVMWAVRFRDSIVPSMGIAIDNTRHLHFL